jgi:SAM-dependent methyltransferase
MTPPFEGLDAAIEAARRDTADYGTRPEFRADWLGLTEESRNLLAQQLRVFGELVGSVTQSLAGWRVLDVGCGDGRWLRRMVDYDAQPEDVVGVDVSDVRFEIGRAKNPLVRLVKSGGLLLPFEEERFDLITEFVCFSHIPTLALRKHTASDLSRVLKKGGYVFWWDRPQTDAPTDRGAPLEPRDYFDWPMRRIEVARLPKPSEGLRPFRGRRLVGKLLDALSHPPTHTAALIGPKP